METQQTWTVIRQQRLQLADALDGLTPDQWEQPSLCTGWRVRDVAAHVTLVGLPPPATLLLRRAVLAGGNFHRLNREVGILFGNRPTAQIRSDLRTHAGSRKVPVVSSQRNVLFDVLVHVQDVGIPLGLDLPMPPEAAREAAQRVWTMGWPFWAKRRLRGLRLTATDVDWAVGEGEDVAGPIAALLLVLTGRGAGLPRLSGSGTRRLADSMRTGIDTK